MHSIVIRSNSAIVTGDIRLIQVSRVTKQCHSIVRLPGQPAVMDKAFIMRKNRHKLRD